MTKYGNKKTIVDNIKFDSKAEAKRYTELLLLEKSGIISELKMQTPFIIAKSCIINGRKRPPMKYLADFTYLLDGKLIIEDVKGKETEGYRIKRHLMKSVLNLEISEIRNNRNNCGTV